jgi:hypothetical protein
MACVPVGKVWAKVYSRFSAGHQLGQAGAVNRALVGQLLRQRDGLAVVVERHQHGHVLLGATDADVDPIDQAVQHMGKVQFSVDQLVAHAGPAGFLRRDDLDAVFLVNAQHRGHDHAGAVGQRDEADLDFLLLGGVGALCVDGGAQRGVDAHGPHRGGLQHGAAAEAGFQKVGHGNTP